MEYNRSPDDVSRYVEGTSTGGGSDVSGGLRDWERTHERQRPRGHTVYGQSFDFDLQEFLDDPESYQAVREVIGDSPADGEFKMFGPVWTLILSDEQTDRLQASIAGSGAIFAAAGLAAPIIGATIAASIAYVHLVNVLGGNNGVEITGVIGTEGVIVTPRGGALFESFADAARIGFGVATVIEWVIVAASKSPAFAGSMQLTALGTIFQFITSGHPLGIALAAGIGLAWQTLAGEPDPNEHGGIAADRTEALAWESFVMADLGNIGQVSLLSHMGLFSAANGGGAGVYANRPQLGDWERWTLIKNDDGSVSFRSIGGHYLVAESGGGSVLNANRTSIGEWEKFWIYFLPGGRIALKTYVTGHFVSVKP
jgi:hypothetical protein